MNKKECLDALDNLKIPTDNWDSLELQLAENNEKPIEYKNKESIDILQNLIEQYFDPKPYEFENLKPDMWAWIEYYKEVGKRGRMTHIKKTYYSEGKQTVMCVEYDSSFSCNFDTFKFYPVTRSLKYTHKVKIKLSKLEYDMIASYSIANDNAKFNAFPILRKLKEKGNFKEVDENLTLKEIKERAVVVDE